jgi:uncharacterized spore protein YtfJ
MLPGAVLMAQAPLEKPLAEFDELVSQLRSGNVVGEPMRAGETTVVPFAAIEFAMGSAGVAIGYAGGLNSRVVPLGVLIVQGDEVRAELIPEEDQRPSLAHEILKGILERKVVFMGNGLNIGNATGTLQELAPLIAAQMGQTTIVGNALNLGSVRAPAAAAAAKPSAQRAELERLFEAKKYTEALALVKTMIAEDPKDASLQAWKTRIQDAMKAGKSAPNPK